MSHGSLPGNPVSSISYFVNLRNYTQVAFTIDTDTASTTATTTSASTATAITTTTITSTFVLLLPLLPKVGLHLDTFTPPSATPPQLADFKWLLLLVLKLFIATLDAAAVQQVASSNELP